MPKPPKEDGIYDSLAKFCYSKGNKELKVNAFALRRAERRPDYYPRSPQWLDSLLLEIADTLSGFPEFHETPYWTKSNTEGLDLAVDIYTNMLHTPDGSRETFCAFLGQAVYHELDEMVD